MHFPRNSGILLHITSLPGELGIGDLGSSSRAFVDFLSQAKQKIWQILPLCPPAQGNSPYSSYSAFAGNPLMISLQDMANDGWISADQVAAVSDSIAEPDGEQVDFTAVEKLKYPVFEKSFADSEQQLYRSDEFQKFCQENDYWLDDFALFEALSAEFGTNDWSQWPRPLARHDQHAMREFASAKSDRILFSKFLQFVFESQWQRLKNYAHQHDVQMYGDLPIFVAYESADVWANQDLFHLDDEGNPTLVAGVPPDYFSPTGQRWGNPLYRWEAMEAEDYQWWVARFRRMLDQFSIIRVDHFRGFEAYWEIPAEAPDAVSGKWKTGPGEKPFEAARKALGELPIVAEDLGLITEEVHQLRERLDFPTMRVMQFGFASPEDNFHRPDQYPEHCVAYTGTHDNDTIIGWYLERQVEFESSETVDVLAPQLDSSQPVHLQLIEMVMNSKANTAIFPMQDFLGLDNESRMNVPATVEGNWQWKLKPNALDRQLADTIAEMTNLAKRT